MFCCVDESRDKAREGYERRHLRSPINGVVTKVALRVGDSTGPA